MVQINMVIKGRIETKTYNNLEITCDAKDTDYNILLTSTGNQHIYCMELLHVTFREKKLFVPHVYPLMHINYFSFDDRAQLIRIVSMEDYIFGDIWITKARIFVSIYRTTRFIMIKNVW